MLVVRTGAIGDVANALCFATALKQGLRDLHLGWVVHPLAEPLVRGHPDVDRLHVWPRGSGWAGWRRLVSELRAERYDTAVDLQRLQKSAFLVRCSGAQRRVGFIRGRVKEVAWIWTNERVDPGPAWTHMAETYRRMAAHFVTNAQIERRLPDDPAGQLWAKEQIRLLGGAPLLLNLGATKAANRWPAERFGALAASLAQRGVGPLALIGGPGDRTAAETALAAAGANTPLTDLVGKSDLSGLIALLRLARGFVGCDTGPMHLAAAVGCPVLALFGAADERRTGPYGLDRLGRPQQVLREKPPCAPCNLRSCPLPRHLCMLDLSVERVTAAVLELVGA
jgi:lipopolysaccharide heptosyltransferase II